MRLIQSLLLMLSVATNAILISLLVLSAVDADRRTVYDMDLVRHQFQSYMRDFGRKSCLYGTKFVEDTRDNNFDIYAPDNYCNEFLKEEEETIMELLYGLGRARR